MKDIEQSVKEKLKNIAKDTGKDYNFVCIQYMQERFLARLEKSKYRENFILKGALMFLAYDIPVVRPSKDIDLLGKKTSNEVSNIRSAVTTVANIELNDGVNFNADRIEIEPITENAEYGGWRIKISTIVGKDNHRLQIDVGFGDMIVGGPVDMNYPSLLEFSSPNIKVYSLESAMAEKFEAIVNLGTFGSRMKDYFDVWFMIHNHELNSGRLQKAIQATFGQRDTPVSDMRYIFSEEFKSDQNKSQQWQAFLNRSSIEIDYTFDEIVSGIEEYMNTVVEQ
jgi:predicted nucleotidyltransferase component of viral defense system